MTTVRIASFAAAAFALVFSVLSFQADAQAYETYCDAWVDVGDLPGCLSFLDETESGYGECAFQVRVMSDCAEEVQLAFFCDEDAEFCPSATAVKPHGEELIALGSGHAYDALPAIQVASLSLDASGTIYRHADEYYYGDWECGNHMGCSAAGQGPGSLVLVVLAALGLVVIRRR